MGEGWGLRGRGLGSGAGYPQTPQSLASLGLWINRRQRGDCIALGGGVIGQIEVWGLDPLVPALQRAYHLTPRQFCIACLFLSWTPRF